MSRIAFDKYQGLGNDFLVIEADDAHAASFAPDVAARLCDRRFGIGADGVLLVLPPSGPRFAARMRVVNADGSIPEMCGNGLRCVALHVARRRGVDAYEADFETDAGERHAKVARPGNAHEAHVTVDMGEIRVGNEVVLEIDGESVRVIEADAGNPHAILLPIDDAHDHARIERLGPRIERHSRFPRGTNVELVSREGAAFRLTVWERGVGFTLACGTGACATAGVLVARGLAAANTPIAVRLPGGDLRVTILREASGKAMKAIMAGPAVHVFSGETT
jgi:diaminopimelate epimerase